MTQIQLAQPAGLALNITACAQTMCVKDPYHLALSGMVDLWYRLAWQLH